MTAGGERTMRTCLGAAADMCTPDLLPEGWSRGAGLVHVEGYILYKPQLATAALQAARASGSLVRLCVHACMCVGAYVCACAWVCARTRARARVCVC